MIQDTRVQTLNGAEPDEGGAYVLYWMQASQRVDQNPALEYALDVANTRGQPLVVLFCLVDDYPFATERAYAFMLEGLAETAEALKERGIPFVFKFGDIVAVVRKMAEDASVLVCDRSYLRPPRDWREDIAHELGRRVVQVEGNAVVPLEVASRKLESGARTIRPKINRHLEDYLKSVEPRPMEFAPKGLHFENDLDPQDVDGNLRALSLEGTVSRVSRFEGGTSHAYEYLAAFLRDHLDGYADKRSDPARPATSMLSPYLHFGMVSPVEIVRRVRDAKAAGGKDAASYVEELVVRRELANNFVYYQPDYGTWKSIPDWAKTTLAEHRDDRRDATYSRDQLEAAETDDPYWNAAMREMLHSGYMHNYMRMYWGKQIVYWMKDAEEAFETALTLNNTYFLDGRDANSYSNVSWLFGVHDRPWPVQPGFGKVRSMKPSGLKRKFDPDAYVRWVDELVG